MPRLSIWVSLSAVLAASLIATTPSVARNSAATCDADNGGITLPPGFCATVFADNLGHPRHMVVAADGVLYVNTWSGRYYQNDTPPAGGFLVALRDTRHSGHADVITRFGPGVSEGSAGGTGIALFHGALFAEVNDRIVRYALSAGKPVPSDPPQTIVSGLPLTGDHPMHPFAIDASGKLYVDLGSATNACQVQNRMTGSPGISPCTELATRGGIWRYDANRTGQVFSPAQRFAKGIRNADGIVIDSDGKTVYATQHGRDQLSQNWPKLYTTEQGADLPSEELLRVARGGDYGWPECYFDNVRGKLMLAPEYGGDGKKVGECATKRAPLAVFPGHWAPNDLLLYYGSQFPNAYRGGAFIAFHGSWNRAPLPQGGYNVVFQPLSHGKPTGQYVVFADGFAGAVKDPGRAAHRPSGLAVGPDGSLYISDDSHGRIWRVTYQGGDAGASVEAAPAPKQAIPSNGASDNSPEPPEGIHPNAGASASGSLRVPPGATAEQVALGQRIFRGEVGGAPCAGCHGGDGAGTPLGADLTSGAYLWGDGSVAAIKKTIAEGVAQPKNHTGVMPPMGGAQLSPEQLSAVAAYVWALGHNTAAQPR
jgi:glucose/arabinose dehydrogenase/mono/diheme cytochrome c family protein